MTSVQWSQSARHGNKVKQKERRKKRVRRAVERKTATWRKWEEMWVSPGETEEAEERQAVRREAQPIRDEMELLESERRILSPGCCTGEREERREGEGEN